MDKNKKYSNIRFVFCFEREEKRWTKETRELNVTRNVPACYQSLFENNLVLYSIDINEYKTLAQS